MRKLKPILLFAVLTYTLQSCISDSKANSVANSKSDYEIKSKEFIHPPIKGVDVPFEVYSVNAQGGDTLFSNSGSVLIFPSNSLVDENGKELKGVVKISYREFADPADLFISGIPMDYDSAGQSYTLQSAGMFEIEAECNGKKVFVNPKRKPEINLVSNTAETKYNVYALDTVKRIWMLKGKDAITVLENPKSHPSINDFNPTKAIEKTSEEKLAKAIISIDKNEPLLPQLADDSRPSFSLEIEKNSYPELSVYNNMKFEVAKEELNYNPELADEEWTYVKVNRSPRKGLYYVEFSKPGKRATIMARPVFEEEDYSKALASFEEEKGRLEKERRDELSRKSRQAIQEKKELEEQKKRDLIAKRESENQSRRDLLYRARLDKITRQKAQLENMGNAADLNLNGNVALDVIRNIYRTFQIDGLGIGNCDFPIVNTVVENAFPVNCRFKDQSGYLIRPDNLATIFDGVRTVKWQDVRTITENFTPCYLLESTGIQLLVVKNNELYFVSKSDYDTYHIKRPLTFFTFELKKYEGDLKTYEDVANAIRS